MTYPVSSAETLSGLITPMERGLYKATIVIQGDASAPQTEAEFKLKATELRTDTMSQALSNAVLHGDIERFRFPSSVWTHWEQYHAIPNSYLPVGDAYCRFNPVYGQGMSVAAIEAVLLRKLARTSGPDQLPAEFLSHAAPIIAAVWKTAVLSQQPEGLSQEDKAAALYLKTLFDLASTRGSVAQTVLDVIHLVKEGDALMTQELQALVADEMDRRQHNPQHAA